MRNGPGLAALLTVLCVVLADASSARADSALFVEFGGEKIPGSETEGNPNFLPNVSAVFFVDNTNKRLTIHLTYDPSDAGEDQLAHNSEVLAGLVFDVDNKDLVLSPDKALVASGSALVSAEKSSATVTVDETTKDVSSEWAFRSGTLPTGSSGVFDFGVSAVGTLEPNNSFGPNDRFDTTTNLFGPDAPDGTNAGLVNMNALLNKDGLPNNDPFIRDTVALTFDFTDSAALPFSAFQISKVQPFFGSDGIVLDSPPDVFNAVPEPTSLAMAGLGVLGLLVYGWRRRRRGRLQPACSSPA